MTQDGTAAANGILVTPSGGALGADIVVPDIDSDEPAIWAAVEQAALTHQVIRFRGLKLDASQVVAIARHLGSPFVRGEETARLGAPPNATVEQMREDAKNTDESHPEIGVVSNVVENGKAKGVYGSQNLIWHSDMVTADIPAGFTVLYAVEAPSGEGQTIFTSIHAAAEALSATDLTELAGYTLKNSRAANAGGAVESFGEITDVTTSPGKIHPLVTVHPITGRPGLFLGRRLHAYIPGLSVEESERKLDAIWAHVTRDEFQWTQDWRPGDLVVFDNRAVLHRREPFSPDGRRVVQQIVLRGTPPPVPCAA